MSLMNNTFNTKTYNTLKTATVSTTDVLETKTPTLPHTNEVGLKQVALSSSIKKGRKSVTGQSVMESLYSQTWKRKHVPAERVLCQ